MVKGEQSQQREPLASTSEAIELLSRVTQRDLRILHVLTYGPLIPLFLVVLWGLLIAPVPHADTAHVALGVFAGAGLLLGRPSIARLEAQRITALRASLELLVLTSKAPNDQEGRGVPNI